MSSAGRKVAWLLLAIPAWGQNTAFYPTRAVTINDLTIATNNAATTLNGSLTSGATTINVASTSLFLAPVIIFMEPGTANAEAALCLTKSASAFTSCTRGFDNTTAIAHNDGRAVKNVVGAYHYNQLAAEIIAHETDHFAGGAVVRGMLGLTSGTQGSVLCFDTTTHLAPTATLGLNLIITGQATICPTASLASVAPSTGDISTPGAVNTGVGSSNAGFSLYQAGTSAFPPAGKTGAAWGAPSSVPVTYEVTLPSAVPATTGSIGQHLACITPSASVSNCIWVTDPLTGTSGSIGGGALAAGACASGTIAITGSTTAMAVVVTPQTYPGDAIYWKGYVSSAGTVTVKVCAASAATPTASLYVARLVP